MLLITYGTRPEYIKVYPVINEMKKRGMPYKTFFTGQHVDLLKGTERPDHILEITKGSNRLDSIVQSILNKEEIFVDITCVMVQGDTSSAFATALAAFHRKIPVAHLEAGLRTFDKYSPYPEEFNRCAISALAEIHLCPTKTSATNLKKEGRKNIHVVGNTVLDNLNNINTSTSNKVIVTLHRREKLNNIKEWFEVVNKIAQKYRSLKFILPIHPNPDVRKHADILSHVEVVDPLGHKDFITHLSECSFIITDSGGVQEEAAFLKKPCIVCRDFTERVEGLNTFSVLCREPKHLENLVDTWAITTDLSKEVCPYGDGKSSQYICDLLKNI
jgi:UDP-N-acetylglucosamine 2-epimerase (non-hydrolysing)